jgi:hypothetical protein
MKFGLLVLILSGTSAYAMDLSGHWVAVDGTAKVSCDNGYSGTCSLSSDFVITQSSTQISTSGGSDDLGSLASVYCGKVFMVATPTLDFGIQGNQLLEAGTATVPSRQVGQMNDSAISLDTSQLWGTPDPSAPLNYDVVLSLANGELTLSQKFTHLGVNCAVTGTIKSVFP